MEKLEQFRQDMEDQANEARDALIASARGRRVRADSLSPNLRAAVKRPWIKREDRGRAPNDYAVESLVKLLLREDSFADAGWREDVGETRLFTTLLKYTVMTAVPTLYVPNQVRSAFPVDSSVPPGAQTVAYHRITDHGDLELISNKGNDIPEVEFDSEEDIFRLASFSGAFSWSLDDLEAAAFAGVSLPTEGLGVLNRAAERNFELISLQGLAIKGITGAYNDANITPTVPTTGAWATATHDQIVFDIHDLIDGVHTANGRNYRPTRLLIPSSLWRYLSTRRTNSDLNVLAAIQQDYPGLSVMEINRADLYDVAGTGPRIMALTPNASFLKIVEARRFTLEPAEKKGFRFRIPGRQKLGGCQMTVPLTAGYMDGC